MKVAPRSFSLIMARVPAMYFQGEKKGRLLLSLVNTNMKVFVIMLKRYRGRCSLVVILALILFFFPIFILEILHNSQIWNLSRVQKNSRGYKGSIFAFCKYLFAAPPPPLPPQKAPSCDLTFLGSSCKDRKGCTKINHSGIHF